MASIHINNNRSASMHTANTVQNIEKGYFSLKLNHMNYPFHYVANSSPGGFDILLPVRLSVNTTVSLNFYDHDLTLTVRARVTHCTRQDHFWCNSFSFYPENGDKNILFFMALRKFLDDFDHRRPENGE